MRIGDIELPDLPDDSFLYVNRSSGGPAVLTLDFSRPAAFESSRSRSGHRSMTMIGNHPFEALETA